MYFSFNNIEYRLSRQNITVVELILHWCAHKADNIKGENSYMNTEFPCIISKSFIIEWQVLKTCL